MSGDLWVGTVRTSPFVFERGLVRGFGCFFRLGVSTIGGGRVRPVGCLRVCAVMGMNVLDVVDVYLLVAMDGHHRINLLLDFRFMCWVGVKVKVVILGCVGCRCRYIWVRRGSLEGWAECGSKGQCAIRR